MIKITIPPDYEAERRYILDVLLSDFLGLNIEITIDAKVSGFLLNLPGEKSLQFLDDFFSKNQLENQANKKSPVDAIFIPLDALPFATSLGKRINSICLPTWKTNHNDRSFYESSKDRLCVNADLFGAAFFFLSRYEEFQNRDTLDQHARFPSSASFAVRHGILTRAAVNEYLEVLWGAIKQLVPQLKRRQRSFRQLVSHDVDLPFDLLFKTPSRFAKSLVGDLLKRKDPVLALRRLARWQRVRRSEWATDPYNTFEWIWSQSEKRGLQSAFYFMAGRTSALRDADYEIEHPAIRGLIRSSAARGHEIGLHPSYESSYRPEIIDQEFSRLKKVCAEEGVIQQRWGGRHHYLRWSAPETARHWESAGLAYDSTLGFADRIGFRCGTCYEYPMFDLSERRALLLRERPLLIMDVSLIASEYMGLENPEVALERVVEIKKICRNFSGDFTLLWHNDRLMLPALKDLYLKSLDG